MTPRPPIPKSDAALVQECLSGNEISWTQLTRRYQKMVKWLAIRQGLNELDAEDVAQIVFERIYKSLSKLRDPNGLKAWIWQTANNEIARWFRDRRPSADALGENVAQNDQNAERAELHDVFRRMEHRVSRDQWRILDAILRNPALFNDDEAIAAILNIKSIDSVHSSRMKALHCLREELDRQGIKPKTHVPKID